MRGGSGLADASLQRSSQAGPASGRGPSEQRGAGRRRGPRGKEAVEGAPAQTEDTLVPVSGLLRRAASAPQDDLLLSSKDKRSRPSRYGRPTERKIETSLEAFLGRR